jgi:hypothetical protein
VVVALWCLLDGCSDCVVNGFGFRFDGFGGLLWVARLRMVLALLLRSGFVLWKRVWRFVLPLSPVL